MTLPEIEREIEILRRYAERYAALGLDLDAKVTGVELALQDRAKMFCELVAKRTKLEQQ